MKIIRKFEVKRIWARQAPRGKFPLFATFNEIVFLVRTSVCVVKTVKFYFRSSARIGTLLEQLQKLCLAGSEAKYDQEKLDVEQLRYVTNKIQQLLSSQGNGYSYVI